MHILIVDDKKKIRSLLSQILTQKGHKVTMVSSGEKALETFREKPYPLVISDIMMEGMSGLELLKEIKQINPDTQALMITGYPSMETVTSGIQAGVYDYLIKPFKNIALIKATMDRAIEKVRLITENHNLLETLKKNKKELECLKGAFWDIAIHDDLTGLHSYRYFLETLTAELIRSHKHERIFSLLFMDVDFFKDYNDTFGRSEGDKVLRELAKILRKWFRKSDIIARYGGDEFIILLPETKKDGAKVVAKEICKRVEEHAFRGKEIQPQRKITVSINVASFPEDGKDSDSLIKALTGLFTERKERCGISMLRLSNSKS